MGSAGTGKGLVLLTGGTGHIGFRTLVEALSTGYDVRAAIRRESSIDEIKATKSVQPYLSKLSFVTVPDILAEGAYDEAVKDVDYIIHLASPLAIPSDDDEKTIIQPAIHGTVGILHSALKAPSVKRIVITASIASVMPLAAYAPGFTTVVQPNDTVPDMAGPYPHTFAAYAASKVGSFNATTRFVQEQNPGFSVVRIMPAFVIGNNELAKTRKEVNAGTNRFGLNPALGVQNPAGLTSLTCHVDDVAFVHVQALDSQKVASNANLGVVYNGLGGGINWESAQEIVKKHFPKEVEEGVFPLNGTQPSHQIRFDSSETEKILGFKFQGWEEQVVSVASAYAKATA